MKIGTRGNPYIIAELGSNFETFEDIKESIVAAKGAGADCIKFQFFSEHDLYGHGDTQPNIPFEWIPLIKEKCDATGIEFACTAFSEQGYDIINPWVEFHKVASSEATHGPLLRKIKTLGKPVILSTGGSTAGDISLALSCLEPREIILNYCVAAYPATEFHFNYMLDLEMKYGLPMGFSDHSLGWQLPVIASRHYGAVVVEKHFGLERIIFDHRTPDAPHSINEHDLQRMIQEIRTPRLNYQSTQEEKPMWTRHKRRIKAMAPIQEGDTLVYGKNFGCFRSKEHDEIALSGFLAIKVNGKTSKKDLNIGDSIGPGYYA